MPLTFTTNTNLGFAHETNFQFVKNSLASYNILLWDFGDGSTEFFNKNLDTNIRIDPLSTTAFHSYTYPGLYKISLSAWSEVGGGFEYAENYVKVQSRYKDAILFTQTPSAWNIPGQKTTIPYVVSLTSTRIAEPISIVLHSTNSSSIPYDAVDKKWRFIVPTWYFTKASTDEIIPNVITLSTSPIYSNGAVVAVSATESFYYIDHTPTITPDSKCPVVITATLSTEHFSFPLESKRYPYSSYSNNQTVKAAAVWNGIDVTPTNFKVTENFIHEIYPIKWTNVPIPVMITCQFNSNLNLEFNSVDFNSGDILNYPSKNEYGALNTISLRLSNVNPNSYVVESSSLKFQKFDNDSNLTTGYIFTTITPLSPISQTSIIAEGTVVKHLSSSEHFDFPIGYPINTSAYVSHPYANSINKIDIANSFSNCEQYSYYNNLGLLQEGKINSISVPENSFTDKLNLSLSGGSGIFGVTFNPVNNLLYCLNADNNLIYVLKNGEIIKTRSLSADIPNYLNNPISPSWVSIDKNHNVWVSLYDSSLILKYDSLLNTVLASASPPQQNAFDAFNLPYFVPPVVETDHLNNVWSCFCHPQSSCLVKYNSSGQQLLIKKLPLNAVPVGLSVSKQNDVWVACREGNGLFCYNTNGTQISSIDILKPSFIAHDKQNNVWILHGYNLISVLNTKTAQMSSWKFTNNPVIDFEQIRTNYISFNEYPENEKQQAYLNDEIWGGLSVDVLNRVWFVNSEKNLIGVFSAQQPNDIRISTLVPTASTNYFVGPLSQYITNVETNTVRSAQAFGDWTGNKWYQKYGNRYFSAPLSGTSNVFSVLNLKGKNTYKQHKDIDFSAIAKVNEDFNFAEYFESLALPELLSQNQKLFQDFLPALIGSGRLDVEEIGRKMYEKIANFNLNHSDIDLAEIDQLINLSTQLNNKIKTYGIDFPADIRKLLNIFSVSIHYLRGCVVVDPSIENNIGAVMTHTAYITAGQYIYARDKRYRTFQLVLVAPNDAGDEVYPLSAIDVKGLRGDITEPSNTNFKNYLFFEMSTDKPKTYANNLIDWNSPYTTLQYSISTADAFYEKNGVVDLYFNNLLTKQLFDQ